MYKTLVVDDEFWMCEGLKVVIEQCCPGFSVTDMAYDGLEAINYMEKNEYDLVITDIRMTEMDGLQFLEEMSKRGWEIPVIVISVYGEFEYARKAFRFGAFDYLLKPLDREEIQQVMQNMKDQLDKENQVDGFKEDDDQGEEKRRKGIQVVNYLKEKVKHAYMKDIGVSTIADEIGYNPSYLSRVFKLETGIGFVQYLTKKRMDVACKYLRETNMSVARIAEQSGYTDDKYFSRIFKKEFGHSPGEYRKRNKR